MTRFEELTHRVRNAVRQKREAENSSSTVHYSISVKVTVELDSQLLTSCPADLENLPAKTS